MATSRDFWLACGHHLLDLDPNGWAVVTDEFLRAYLARPEITPSADSCLAESALHSKLLNDPRSPISSAEVSKIAQVDARENWALLLAWRDHLLRHRTLEAAYLALVLEGQRFPVLFIDQIVQAILRNLLDDCEDAFMLRAAEMFFRPQKLQVHEGSLLAADAEFSAGASPSPLASLLGLATGTEIEVLSLDNASMYWDRSDSFDLALDLTAGRRGVAALGEVASRWIQHLFGLEVSVVAMKEVRDVALTWYIGLDANATRFGDALWRGTASNDTSDFIIGLYDLRFTDEAQVIDRVRGEPTYLIVAATRDMTLRLKPQNLITGLPLRPAREVSA